MDSQVVSYVIDLAKADQHLIRVHARIPVAGRHEIAVFLPAWTPGSYLVREYARQIESLQSLDRNVSVHKTQKDEWLVTWGNPSRDFIELSYELYAREKSVRTNWIEPDFCFLTGAATFITSDSLVTREHQVELKSVRQDSQVICSLPQETSGPDTYTLSASSYDVLVDSPILIGQLIMEHFEVSGRQHRLASTKDARFWDHHHAAQDVARIVATVQEFWQDIPYDAYDFQNLILGGYGGLEHDNCTVLMTDRWTMHDRKAYVDWLGLVCHEFFHTWNVRRLRPKSLQQYNYRAEQYLVELWIAEGITSYFDDLLVLRAGLCSRTEFFERLGKQIQTVMNAPGRLVQSLADSSFDTWIKLYRPDENSNNSRISYYTKGACVAWLLDTRIRKLTENKLALDNVMRLLWQRYREFGYTCGDFETLVSELVPGNWAEWFDYHVRSAGELDFHEPLEYFGLQFQDSNDYAGNELDPLAFSQIVPPEPGETSTVAKRKASGALHCDVKNTEGRTIITRLVRGGSASMAGLQVDDELIAINDLRVPSSGLATLLNNFVSGQTIRILYSRRDVVAEAILRLGAPLREWKLITDSSAAAVKLENLSHWLGTIGRV